MPYSYYGYEVEGRYSESDVGMVLSSLPCLYTAMPTPCFLAVGTAIPTSPFTTLVHTYIGNFNTFDSKVATESTSEKERQLGEDNTSPNFKFCMKPCIHRRRHTVEPPWTLQDVDMHADSLCVE